MPGITSHLTTKSSNLPPLEVLHAPPSVLLGVAPEAIPALAAIDVATVFDLAHSRVFGNASMLVDAAENPRTVLARYGLAPADVLGLLPAGLTIDDLPRQPIAILDGVGAANAAALADALEVQTVRDLALWPPYLAARDIARRVLTPDDAPDADPEAPVDLLPKSGEFPTERVFYSTLVFDGPEGDQPNLKPLDDGPAVDLTPVAGPNFGFTKPGIGALLTFAQSWFAQGVALGQLLHSVALAPGESTRLAMIDWSRRTSGKQDESVSEVEQLTNVTEHSRALSEVTSAVATEAQSGFSQTEVDAVSEQSGGAGGFSLGPITLGGSDAGASSHSKAMSFSSSSGRRDLGASMTQNVVDRTQQQANAARNRRATVVKEVSETEHEQISTRVVTNYNHMHALSVQYYEVVQIYRVTVALQRAERCLFVPMKMVDFHNADVVRMFRKALLAAAIDEDARALLATDFDAVEVKALNGATFNLKNGAGIPAEVKDGGKTLRLPDEAKLTGITIFRSRGGMNDLQPLTTLEVKLRDGSKGDVEIPAPGPSKQDAVKVGRIPLREIGIVTMAAPDQVNHDYYCEFICNYKGTIVSFEVSLVLPVATPVVALTVTGGGIWDRLIAHLEANRLHYSQAIFTSLDPASVTLLLSGYSYKGRPLAGMIDPQPVTTAGNYLVFRTHVTPDLQAGDEQREWAEWLTEHGVGFDHLKEDLVPLPSGGVFAEGVLGRYNSAEKLDLTRFWNWQDSPIPITAPEIAAVQAGQHTATDPDLKAGSFSQPLVNIVSPTSLPDPAGLGPAFQAIANGNMFRDMSGLAATIGLAQAGLQTTSDAATAAGVQAGSNMAIAAKKEVEMFKAALAFAGAVMGAGSTDTSPSTISNDGAKINHGRSLDQRGITSGSSGNGSVPAIGGGGGGASGGGTPGASGAGGSSGDGAGGSNEEAAFNRSVWGSRGESGQQATRTLLGFGLDGGLDGGGDAGTPAALNAGPFAQFVTANKLDLEIADLLRELDGYPADSWAKQIAAFAHHELIGGNLLGIFSSAHGTQAKAVVPAGDRGRVDTAIAGIGNGVTIDSIGGPGAWKGLTLIADSLVQGGRTAGAGRQRLAQVLAHELTHFRNRDFFVPLQTSQPADHPTFYVDLAKANAHPGTAKIIWSVMGEAVACHVAWRVQQDLAHKATGAAIRPNPNLKGFFRAALALDGGGWADNGYLADLKAATTYNRQIAEWLKIVGGQHALFHDDPTKNTATRQFFVDVYDTVKPGFVKPTESDDGWL